MLNFYTGLLKTVLKTIENSVINICKTIALYTKKNRFLKSFFKIHKDFMAYITYPYTYPSKCGSTKISTSFTAPINTIIYKKGIL